MKRANTRLASVNSAVFFTRAHAKRRKQARRVRQIAWPRFLAAIWIDEGPRNIQRASGHCHGSRPQSNLPAGPDGTDHAVAG